MATIQALNANVYGNGSETLVLAHGYGSDQTVWSFLIPYLICYFKVIVFDLAFSPNVQPNYYDPKKYSTYQGYATDLVSLLDELQVKKTIYMGHSMSAMIGCIASVDRPDLFQHIVLLGASPRYLDAKGYFGGFRRTEVEAVFKAIKQNYSRWVGEFAPVAVGVYDITAINKFAKSLGSINPRTALAVARTVFLSDLRNILPQVRHPCTVIQTEKDFVVPDMVVSYIVTKLGGPVRLEILKTEGHLPQLTAYPLIIEALKTARVIK